MIRITTIFLCVLLAAAAWGRYKAEVSVRETRQEIEKLNVSIVDESRKIQILRAEIAYLENPERLEKVAQTKTDLRPSERTQLLSARQFAAAFNDDVMLADDEPSAPSNDVILNAIAMAQLGDAQ